MLCWSSQATMAQSIISFHHSNSATTGAYVAANPADSSSLRLDQLV